MRIIAARTELESIEMSKKVVGEPCPGVELQLDALAIFWPWLTSLMMSGRPAQPKLGVSLI